MSDRCLMEDTQDDELHVRDDATRGSRGGGKVQSRGYFLVPKCICSLRARQ